MVLNMVNLGKCWESFQTPWNALYVLPNVFASTFGIVPEDFGWIPKGPKSTDFDQNPWAPMVLNRVDLGKCWESFQTLWNAPC